jgi:hypothetical protein
MILNSQQALYFSVTYRNSLASQSFGGGQFNKDVSSSLAFKSQHSNLDDDQSDLQYLNAHPKPLAVCIWIYIGV